MPQDDGGWPPQGSRCSQLQLPALIAHLDRNITALQAAVVHNCVSTLAKHHQPPVVVRHKLRRGRGARVFS